MKKTIWNVAVWFDLFVIRNASAYRRAAARRGFLGTEHLNARDLYRLYRA